MYAKLFSRISQSSLMEEKIETRYVFMMLLAIADQNGDVIGTDVAISRIINVDLDTFVRCVAELCKPDEHSNSTLHEGRRLIESENGRGYNIVNYVNYSKIKNHEEKKEYMREYMRNKRAKLNDVKNSNFCKTELNDVTHIDIDTNKDKDIKKKEALPHGVLFSESWNEWITHLTQKRKKPTELAKSKQLKKLAELTESDAIHWINNAIEKNWQSIYEPINGNKNTKSQNPSQYR